MVGFPSDGEGTRQAHPTNVYLLRGTTMRSRQAGAFPDKEEDANQATCTRIA